MAELVKSKWVALIVVLGSLLSIFLVRARWDPEAHHDGVIYASALAVREGLAPNRDVFAQYGPLVPEIQGLWLRWLGPGLLNLRILNALVLAGIGVLLFNLCKSRVGALTSGLITLSWALANPRPCQQTCSNLFSVKLPWPSVFSTLILMIALTLLNSKQAKRENSVIRITVFAGVGILLVIGGFARIQLFVSALFIVLSLFFRLGKYKNEKYSLLVGSLLTALASIILLKKYHIWQPFLQQCIFWSFNKYGKSPALTSMFINILWFPGVALTFLGFWLTISRAINSQHRLLKSISILAPSVIFILAAITMTLGRSNSSYPLTRTGNFLVDISSNFLSCAGYSSAIFLLYQAISLFFRARFKKSHNIARVSKVDPVRVASFTIAGTALFQLYPLFDPIHLWWITPLLITGVLSGRSRVSKSVRLNQRAARVILIGLTLAGSFQYGQAAKLNRIPFQDLTLKGMTGSPDEVRRVDSTMQMLENYGAPRKIKFFCADGLYAAAGNKYLAADGNFVAWAPNDSQMNQTMYTQAFVCNVYARAIKDFQQIGWKLIAQTADEPGYGISALFEIH